MLPLFCGAQNYIDLVTIGYGQVFNNKFEGHSGSTSVKSIDADLTFPIVLNGANAIVTGLLFSRNHVTLFPSGPMPANNTGAPPFPFTDGTSLYSTTLKIGLATTFNERWSGTFVALPKLASDYVTLTNRDLYMGGAALFKYKKRENLVYRFGLYAMGQAYGLFTTPILGFYYLAPGQKFEADVSMPVSADVNYKLGNHAVGFDYFAIGRSFYVHKQNAPTVYVDYVALELAAYYQYGILDNSILLRAKAGYATSDLEVYAEGDNLDLRVSAIELGDGRTQLNPAITGGAFLKFEAIYRFRTTRANTTKPGETLEN
ncbi:MAG: DUF6268 family outer membrane beta-barrel protein [Marinirhabdus sp.]